MKIKPRIYAQALAELMLDKKVEDKKIVDNFLKLLEKNRDIRKTKEILNLAEALFVKKTGRRKIVVETARKMNVKQKDLVQSITQQGDIVSEKTNKELIAGIKIIINDNQLDLSMLNKLNNLL
ncbi:MAG: F0F1 ATP synthase subunit delta [Candidatus Staskawiczbacteria bacterium]|nr:F0F1 ATP synthase subunit delta [Candidatus Staskawiczbacteria bacterium]